MKISSFSIPEAGRSGGKAKTEPSIPTLCTMESSVKARTKGVMAVWNLSQNPVKHWQKKMLEGFSVYFCIPHHIAFILHVGKTAQTWWCDLVMQIINSAGLDLLEYLTLNINQIYSCRVQSIHGGKQSQFFCQKRLECVNTGKSPEGWSYSCSTAP